MVARDPFWTQQFGSQGMSRCQEVVQYHLYYLCVAVGTAQPGYFRGYVDWLSGFLGRRGLAASQLQDDLQLLAEDVSRALAPEEAAPFLTMLDAEAKRL